MKVHDLAIIGSGIGGSLISALNKDKDLIVFEKDKNLGGCASTFKRAGYYFNTGATTLVGYEDNHPVKRIFDRVGFNPDIKKSKLAIRVIQNDKVLDRVKDFDAFSEDINRVYPHKNNNLFWRIIKEIDEKFWLLKGIYYGRNSFKSNIKTASFLFDLIKTYKLNIFKSAKSFIKNTLPDISIEYKKFIDSQLLITLQTNSENISLLSLALGLSYPFHDVFYVNGGMGKIFDDLLEDINIHKKEMISKIYKHNNRYRVLTNKDEYLFNKVILNSTIYDSKGLFEDKNIINYYSKFKFNDQSAFVVYLKLNSRENFFNHYQIILKELIPNCISSSFFISFSKKDDEILSKDGYSITISTHTKALFWTKLDKEDYKIKKSLTENFIIEKFLEYFKSLKKEDIIYKASASSKTFKHYINRDNCGGKAIFIKDISKVPTCTTPFKGLYNIGDTVFAGQGWPGIALGVEILNKELNYG